MWTWVLWHWWDTLHSPKLQYYWSFTIRLFNVLSRKLAGRVLHRCRDGVSVFYNDPPRPFVCLLTKNYSSFLQFCSVHRVLSEKAETIGDAENDENIYIANDMNTNNQLNIYLKWQRVRLCHRDSSFKWTKYKIMLCLQLLRPTPLSCVCADRYASRQDIYANRLADSEQWLEAGEYITQRESKLKLARCIFGIGEAENRYKC